MAAFLNPLSDEETTWLTLAMAHSGERIDLTGLPKPWVDKHSTGGVGDKTSLVALPLLAACGLTVVKMSGRGLGITGGTVDKLSSVPGFRLDLSPEEMKEQAKRIGLALTGQTPNLAPADKILYALRDATATVESIPLIVSSILSKKIAGGADTIVLDVKAGSGAFMKTEARARELAEALKRTGEGADLRIRLAITDMEQPLGQMVGNSLEVIEAMRVLRGDELSDPSRRFRDLCVQLTAHALEACGVVGDSAEGERMVGEALTSGRALSKARDWFGAQGANPSLFDQPESLPVTASKGVVSAKTSGWLASLDAEAVGTAVIALGGGREKKEDSIDVSVGIEVHAIVGQRVESGEPLLTIHASSQESAEAVLPMLKGAMKVSETPVPYRPLIMALL